jgi:hypothetical protein
MLAKIPLLNSKLTANESYRITGVRYRRRPLGGVGESRQGMNGHVFFLEGTFA